MLDAVTHPTCINPPGLACNICGLMFAPKWTHIIPGNFWTAQCSYINKLVSPLEFRDKMQRLRKYFMRLKERKLVDILLSKIWPQGSNAWLTGKLLELGCPQQCCHSDFLISQWTIPILELWIVSHPSVVPCDVSQTEDLEAWLNGTVNSSSFSVSLWPRPSVDREYQLHQRHSPVFQLGEKFLLKGLLTSWLFLYNETPPSSSWVWSFFPEGEKSLFLEEDSESFFWDQAWEQKNVFFYDSR